ncbi:MAG: CCA tRNA nucleotidyltransferase [Flavobacteriaceae bacterium]
MSMRQTAPAHIDIARFGKPALPAVLEALNGDGVETRIVGGAVRNVLMGMEAGDIDLATTALPQEVMALGAAAGLKPVPTGVNHGTVTLIADGEPFEVTTLREDVETHGRHATVAFGTDWTRDAERRDFTMNALYVGRDGTVHDPLEGYADLAARRVVFIGDAETRIREDYLRILRFFRFHARFGAGRPDADGLKAATKLKSGINRLSAERVWKELKLILGAAEPGIAMRWMRVSGILDVALPEQAKWGIDDLDKLLAGERANRWAPDAMLRLMSILPPRPDVAGGLADRLKLSNGERRRLVDYARAHGAVANATPRTIDRLLYRHGGETVLDVLKLAVARDNDASRALAPFIARAEGWTKPELPVSGRDLIARGIAPGPAIGEALDRLEKKWIDSGFTLTRDELLD